MGVRSLKASKAGLLLVDQARRQMRWTKTAVDWCQAACTSKSTLNRFWVRQPVRCDTFMAICQAIGLDWQRVVEREGQLIAPPHGLLDQSQADPLLCDWGDAPDTSIFYGRHRELETLRHWVNHDRCRFILMRGMGGMGKSTLAAKLAQVIAPEMTWVIWRSLRDAPPLSDLLKDIQETLRPLAESTVEHQRSGDTFWENQQLQLLHQLRQTRGLLILDNYESILAGAADTLESQSERVGAYRRGYENYGRFWKQLGESFHQSCVLLTTREVPIEFRPYRGQSSPIRCFALQGLTVEGGAVLLRDKGSFTDSAQQEQALVHHYGGNPLALKIAATVIRDYFGGDLTQFAAFLTQGNGLFEHIYTLLDCQFERLSTAEQAVMYWLAINRCPVSMDELQADLLPRSVGNLLDTLTALQQRSLLEATHADHTTTQAVEFTQQPVVMEYVTARLITAIAVELQAPVATIAFSPNQLLNTHALIKATAPVHLQEVQNRELVQPLIDRLLDQYGAPTQLVQALQAQLTQLHQLAAGGSPSAQSGYFCGNLLHLLRSLQHPICAYNFAGLPIWQANLQNLPLHRVNFSRSQFRNCLFTEVLGNILAAAFCPGGIVLATCDTDCNIRIWDVATRQLRSIFRGHRNWVRTVAFAPHPPNCMDDPLVLASGGADQTLRLWDVASGTCFQVLEGHQGEIFTVAWHPNGKLCASGSADHTIKIWDRQTGQCRHTLIGHGDRVGSVAFSPDGRQIVSGSSDNTIRIWDVETGKCRKTLKGHQEAVRAVTYHPRQPLIASGSSDATIKFWQAEQGTCTQTLSAHQQGVYALAFNEDGTLLASGSGDHTARIWAVATGKTIRVLQGHSNQIFAVAFSPSAPILVCVSLDQTVRLWQFHTGQCLQTWNSNTDWIFPIAWSPTGTTIASGSNDHSVRLWERQAHGAEGGQRMRIFRGHEDYVCSIDFSPNGQQLVSASRDQTLRVWEVKTGRCLRLLVGHRDWVFGVRFLPSGDRLVSGSADGTLKLWDWHIGHCVQTFHGHTDPVWTVAVSPDSRWIASGSTDYTLRLWHVASGTCERILTGHTGRIKSVAFSPDGHFLVSGSTDHTLRLWEMKTGQCCRVFTGHQNWVFAVAFSPDGQFIASGSHDWTARLWEMKTGQCRQILTGHENAVSAIAFRPDCRDPLADFGLSLASGSQDQTVRLWNLATGQCQETWRVPRLYEAMDITQATGLTAAQRETLQALGAIDRTRPALASAAPAPACPLIPVSIPPTP